MVLITCNEDVNGGCGPFLLHCDIPEALKILREPLHSPISPFFFKHFILICSIMFQLYCKKDRLTFSTGCPI